MNSIPKSFKPYLAYSASAGSGKTFALAVRYISLLFLGESPQTILAATFTNKAASEMRERVIESLRFLSADKNRPFLDAISAQTGLSRDEILAKQPTVLMNFLESSNFIVTLDSFFASILRSSSFEIGLEPEFAIKESAKDGLEEIFLTELKRMGLLSSLAELAIHIEDKRFLKIFDIMQRLYILDPILPEDRVIIFDIDSIEIEINRIREEILWLLKESGASKTAIKNFESRDISTLFKRPLFSKESLLEHRNYKKYVELYPSIDTLYQELKSLLGDWAEARESIILNKIFEIYSYYKNANITNAKGSNLLTFDDLSYFTYRLLNETVTKEFIYFKIDSKFQHILLDEFQDTSTIQFLMLQPLIDEIFAGEGQGDFRSFFYVGDTKQSLYRFRGGVEELFGSVAESYMVEVLPMDTNYRSSRSVIKMVNHWFSGKMVGYNPQKSRDGADIGFVEVIEPLEDTTESILQRAVDKAKEIISNGISVDTITFLVFANKDGEKLQNICHTNQIDTILKTSSSLNKIAKIASIVAVLKYLFYSQSKKYSAYLSAFIENIEVDIEGIDFSWFNPYLRPFDVIDRLIRDFGYFDKDPNILKLLNFSSKYLDIPTFIEEFESTSISVASNTLHGALIMTIHSSKGLEFKNIIIIDKLTKAKNDTDALLFDFNENLSVENIFYRISGRENFDERYKNLLQKRREASSKDRLNVLYVALTRAIEQMIIIKKKDKSIFDIIDMDITKEGTPTKIEKRVKEDIVDKREPISIGYYGEQNVRKERDSEDEDEKRDYNAIDFGLALHYTLEMMNNFQEDEIATAIESSRNHYGLIIEDSLWQDIESRVKKLVENIEFQDMLKDSINIYKEKAISYNGQLKQMDLLIEHKESYIVIDYKSSKKFQEKHQKQVSYYCKAVNEITERDTKGIILYLLEDRVEIRTAKNC